jgi:hypothetical protein
MKRILLSVFIGLAIFIMAVQPVMATDYYSGNYQGSVYGVKANIYTPSSKPYLAYQDGEGSWVSTAYTPYFVQTGWLCRLADTYATSYVEYQLSGGYDIEYGTTQSWGTYRNYKLNYDLSDTYVWNIYFDGFYLMSVEDDALPTPPTTLYAFSEVKGSPATELYTDFAGVQYMDSYGSWSNFTHTPLYYDYPDVATGNAATYTTYGPDW